jgi:hypothetical protein
LALTRTLAETLIGLDAFSTALAERSPCAARLRGAIREDGR